MSTVCSSQIEPIAHASSSCTYLFGYRFPLDLIKVTEGAPLFSAEESARVVQQAEEEGVDKNEYESGKYKLGGKN